MRLRTRRHAATELPGVQGVARVDRRSQLLLKVLLPGDIAVLSQPDLDARLAHALIESAVGAVVNAAPFTTGRFPNLGPRLLADAGVMMLEVTPDDARKLKDGATLRLHEQVVYDEVGRILIRGRELTGDEVTRQLDEAHAGMTHQLESFTHNTTAFLRAEQDLLLQGSGLPALRVPMAGRPVVVVADDAEAAAQLDRLRRFLREQRPVTIAVGDAVRLLARHRIRPDVLVLHNDALGGPDETGLERDELLPVGDLVVHQTRHEHSDAFDRLQRWGLPAHAVVSDADSHDIALLIARDHGASIIIPVGRRSTMEEFLDRDRTDQASSVLTRLRLDGRLAHAESVARLYGGRTSAWQLWLIVLVALVALWLATATTPIGNVWWHDFWRWAGHLVGIGSSAASTRPGAVLNLQGAPR